MHRMLNEITQIIFSHQVNEIYVIFFDNRVVNAQTITHGNTKLEPFGGGGTNFQLPLDWIHKELKDQVALCLFMTDGYEAMPKEPKIYGKGKSFIWMIYNNDDFRKPFGVKINMGSQNAKRIET
jgi:predicted metal-dependent peptidase